MIDEKGRLFGKINIVDLLVLLVVIIAAGVLAVKFLGNRGEGAGGGPTKVTYTVLVENVRDEVYQHIQEHIPSTLMASGDLLDGQVVAVSGEPHEQTVSVNPSGTALVFNLGENTWDLTFTIECNVVNPITTEIGTQEVRIGKSHIVKTDKFELTNGEILDVTWGDGAGG